MFGTSVPVIKLGLDSFPPDTFVTARFGIAFAIILALPVRKEWIHTSLFRSRAMWTIAVVNMIGYVLQFQGQRYTTSSNAALIISTAALMVPMIAFSVHIETLTLQKIIGVVTGFVGTAMVITRGVSFSVATSELVGDFMILGTAVTIALIFILSKPLTTIQGGRPIAGAIIMMTFILLIPSTLLDIGQSSSLGLSSLGILIYLAIFATVGAYYFFAKGLETVTPIVSSIILPIEVIVAVILSVIIFGDIFNIISAIGAVLIVAGVFLVTSRGSSPLVTGKK